MLFWLRIFKVKFKKSSQLPEKRMPNSFSRTFFSKYWIQYESGALNPEFSKVYFFLPSITDRIEDINRHMGSVNLIPIDISEDSFEVEGGIVFDTSKLDYDNPDREKIKKTVLKVLKKVVHLSNANIVKNADGLISEKSINYDVEWVGETGKQISENPKMSYWFFVL